MKKALNVIGIIFMNLVLIFLALWINLRAERLLKNTDFHQAGLDALYIPIFFIGLIFFFYKQKARFAIGIVALVGSCIIFMIPFLTKSLASKGEYETLKVTNTWEWMDGTVYID